MNKRINKKVGRGVATLQLFTYCVRLKPEWKIENVFLVFLKNFIDFMIYMMYKYINNEQIQNK